MNKYVYNYLQELDGVCKKAIINERIAKAEHEREMQNSEFKVLEYYDLYNQEAFIDYLKERNKKAMTILIYCDEEQFDITVIYDKSPKESIQFKGQNGMWMPTCHQEDNNFSLTYVFKEGIITYQLLFDLLKKAGCEAPYTEYTCKEKKKGKHNIKVFLSKAKINFDFMKFMKTYNRDWSYNYIQKLRKEIRTNEFINNRFIGG